MVDLQKIKETLSEFRKAEHDYNLTSGNPEEERRRLAINAAMNFEALRVVIANAPELSTTANGKRMVELVGPGFLECPITQRYLFFRFTLTKEYENYKHELLLRVHELLLNSSDAAQPAPANEPNDRTHYWYKTPSVFCKDFKIDKDTLKKHLSDKSTYIGKHVIKRGKGLWLPFACYKPMRTEYRTDKKLQKQQVKNGGKKGK